MGTSVGYKTFGVALALLLVATRGVGCSSTSVTPRQGDCVPDCNTMQCHDAAGKMCLGCSFACCSVCEDPLMCLNACGEHDPKTCAGTCDPSVLDYDTCGNRNLNCPPCMSDTCSDPAKCLDNCGQRDPTLCAGAECAGTGDLDTCGNHESCCTCLDPMTCTDECGHTGSKVCADKACDPGGLAYDTCGNTDLNCPRCAPERCADPTKCLDNCGDRDPSLCYGFCVPPSPTDTCGNPDSSCMCVPTACENVAECKDNCMRDNPMLCGGTCDPANPGKDTCGDALQIVCQDEATCTDNCGMKNPSVCGGSLNPDCANTGVADAGPDATADAGDAGDGGHEAGVTLQPPMYVSFSSFFAQGCYCTTYNIMATDPNGGTLSYAWSNSNPCGQFVGGNSTSAVWTHPDSTNPGACPNQAVHPGTITVVVTGPGGSIKCSYAGGSADGTSATCVPGP